MSATQRLSKKSSILVLFSRPSTIIRAVLMRFGALVLVRLHLTMIGFDLCVKNY